MFANRLKQLRIEKKLTQEELAYILKLSRHTITKYESGDREPDFKILTKIADYFNVSTDYLLGRIDEPTAKLLEGSQLPKELIDAGISAMAVFKDYNITAEDIPSLLKLAQMLKNNK